MDMISTYNHDIYSSMPRISVNDGAQWRERWLSAILVPLFHSISFDDGEENTQDSWDDSAYSDSGSLWSMSLRGRS